MSAGKNHVSAVEFQIHCLNLHDSGFCVVISCYK
jgi:hypothetical protein